jgi:DNA-binding response OmpR family regulator
MHAHQPYRIAFVEPAASHTEHLRQLLQFEGMVVDTFGPDDLHRLVESRADVLLLNHSRLRDATLTLALAAGRGLLPRPLTMALVSQGDELRGVELVERGLDAYLVCPCGPREFVARVRALLRRTRQARPGTAPEQPAHVPATIRAGALQVDPLRRRARLGGHELRLTEQEFQLLYFLAGNPGRVFDRQALLDAIWGRRTFVTTRSVDALVKRLRHQLRAGGWAESMVETVRGVGYRMADVPGPAAVVPAA